MPTPESPVLVVHGVNTRDPEEFASRVAALEGRIGCGRPFIPCFWGDLGVDDRHLSAVLPSAAETLEESRAWLADNRGLGSTAVAWVREHALGALVAGAGGEVAANRYVSSAMRRYRHRDRHNELVDEMDAVGFLHDIRAGLTTAIARFAGDVILYQSRHTREAVHARVKETIAEHAPGYGTKDHPLTVVAHSLGGVIALDMAVCEREPLWIDQLVTLGSQPGLFHLIDGRYPHLARYAAGKPVRLPRTVGRWANIWGSIDPLAFLAGKVFVLHDGQRPADVATVCHSLPDYHTYYWTDEMTLFLLAEILFGLPD